MDINAIVTAIENNDPITVLTSLSEEALCLLAEEIVWECDEA